MGFSTKTKLVVATAGASIVVGGIAAEKAGMFDDRPYTPTLTKEATAALHNGGKGFSTLFLDKQVMARPITEAIINQSVEIMMTDMGDHSPQARALGECSIALANNLWRDGTGKVRQQVIKETAGFSFENGAANMPPSLPGDCHRVNVELLPSKTDAFLPVPTAVKQ